MYSANIGSTEATSLFDSGTMLSCISKCFYDQICCVELDRVIYMNAGPPIIIMSASSEELINLGQCKLQFKLGAQTFKYYFQIIKNHKQYLILGLNFQRSFKILQDITEDNDLYFHIRNKIVTFSKQA